MFSVYSEFTRSLVTLLYIYIEYFSVFKVKSQASLSRLTAIEQ